MPKSPRCRPTRQPQPDPAISSGIGGGGFSLVALLAWLAVGIPVAWGVWITLTKVAMLFR